MKITISHQIQLENFKNGYVEIYKEFDNNVIPHKGDFIADTCFKDPYEHEVIEVTINYQENDCFVILKPFVVASNDKAILKNYVEIAELHGWDCPTKDLI